MKPEDPIVNLARKTARSIVDHGSIPMATLKESIKLQDKVDELLKKEIQFPEQQPFPEIPETDLTPIETKLDEILTETKKKDLYDIQISPELKKELRGDKGIDGKDGINGKDGSNGNNGIDGKDGENGKDGSPDTPDQVIEKIMESKKLIPENKVEGLSDLQRIVKHNNFDVRIGVSKTEIKAITDRLSSLESTPNGTITRSGSYISSVALSNGITFSITRDASNYISSITNGSKVWTYTRNGSNQITNWAVT